MRVAVIRMMMRLMITAVLLLFGHRSHGCWEEEKVGLLQIKAFVVQGSFSKLENWKAEYEDCCTWDYVGCDSTTGH